MFHSFLSYLYPHLAKIKNNIYKSAVFLNNFVPVINYLKKVNLTFPIQKKKKRFNYSNRFEDYEPYITHVIICFKIQTNAHS